MKKLLLLFLSIVLVLSACPAVYAAAAPVPPQVQAQGAILVDLASGQVLYAKNEHTRYYPASITKIMTSLLLLEYMQQQKVSMDTVVNIPAEVENTPPESSVLGIKPGDTMTMRDLFTGFLLRSGNDAAIAIAVMVSGSEQAFVQKMNERAAALGMTDTHFMNPHGMEDKEHYTTAADMVKVTEAALAFPDFRQATGTYETTFTCTRDGATQKRTIENSNPLIDNDPRNQYYYPYATGTKTGFLNDNTCSLVACAKKDGRELLAVFLKDNVTSRYVDPVSLFEYGFNNFKTIDLIPLLTRGPFTVKVTNADVFDPDGGNLPLKPEIQTTAFYTAPNADIENIKSLKGVAVTYDPVTAPAAAGSKTTIHFSYNGSEIYTCPATIMRDVTAKPDSIEKMKENLHFTGSLSKPQAKADAAPSPAGSGPLKYLLLAAALAAAGYGGLRAVKALNAYNRKRRKKALQFKPNAQSNRAYETESKTAYK